MLEIVDLRREKDRVDDLGFGVLRDAIASTLVPGISILRTRPWYIPFIGWITPDCLTPFRSLAARRMGE